MSVEVLGNFEEISPTLNMIRNFNNFSYDEEIEDFPDILTPESFCEDTLMASPCSWDSELDESSLDAVFPPNELRSQVEQSEEVKEEDNRNHWWMNREADSLEDPFNSAEPLKENDEKVFYLVGKALKLTVAI